MYIAKSGLYFFFTYLVLMILYRFIMPFGDEPDFSVRTKEIFDSDFHILYPYQVYNLLYSFVGINSICSVDSKPLSLIANINSKLCIQDAKQVMLRTLLSTLSLIPVLLFILFRRKIYSGTSFDLRSDTVAITLLLPSSIYYIGLLSVEHVFVITSFIVFLFWRGNRFVLVVTFAACYLIDIGNFIVLLLFTLYYLSLKQLKNSIGSKYLYVAIASVLVAYVVGYNLVSVLSSVPVIGDRAELILKSYETHLSLNKYPIILRPIITFMSFVFYSADNIKAPLSYILVSFYFLKTYINARRKRITITSDDYENTLFVIITGTLFILTLVFILPTYANAKYFMFLLPFYVHFFIVVNGLKKTYYAIVFLALITYFQIFVGYL